MEDRFGNTVNDKIPTDVQTLAIRIKDYDTHIRKRMYTWWNIIQEKKEDMYIELVIKELQADFERRYPTAKVADETYKKYILGFCEAIARACERVNKLIAHVESGTEIRLEKLGFFDKAVDDKMTLFYNAMVGTDIELITSTTSTTVSQYS